MHANSRGFLGLRFLGLRFPEKVKMQLFAFAHVWKFAIKIRRKKLKTAASRILCSKQKKSTSVNKKKHAQTYFTAGSSACLQISFFLCRFGHVQYNYIYLRATVGLGRKVAVVSSFSLLDHSQDLPFSPLSFNIPVPLFHQIKKSGRCHTVEFL